jgi:hypothetical protein
MAYKKPQKLQEIHNRRKVIESEKPAFSKDEGIEAAREALKQADKAFKQEQEEKPVKKEVGDPAAILKGTDLAFYLAQHSKSKVLAEGFKNDKSSITEEKIGAAQKIFNVKSGLNKLEAVPGQDQSEDYQTVFEADSAALMNQEGDEDYKGTNFDDEIVKIDANIVTLRTNACNELKIQDGCTDEAILQAVKSIFCSAKANLEGNNYSDTNAAKAFCAESINAWDGVLGQFSESTITFDE